MQQPTRKEKIESQLKQKEKEFYEENNLEPFQQELLEEINSLEGQEKVVLLSRVEELQERICNPTKPPLDLWKVLYFVEKSASIIEKTEEGKAVFFIGVTGAGLSILEKLNYFFNK